MNQLIHPLTKQQLANFAANPSHAVMLAGPSGAGKLKLAISMSDQLLNASFEVYPYKLLIEPETGKAIGIEAIRELEHFLSLKVPRNSDVNRIVIVNQAHALTLEAQNGLLKTLEEPPEATVIIMVANNSQALLPTIRSRVQAIDVKRPEKAAVLEHFKSSGHNSKDIDKVYAISGGLPGLMEALLEDDNHPLLQAVEQARQLISLPTYEKLLLVDVLSKQRGLALDTVNILQQMADVSLQTAKDKAAKKWQRVLEASYQAAEALQANAQPKLLLTRLMLSL